MDMKSNMYIWRQAGTGSWLRGAEEGLVLEALHTHTIEQKKKGKKGGKMSEKDRYSRI